VRLFWWLSDHGQSTWRAVTVSAMLMLVFALLYLLVPGLVDNLHEPTASREILLLRSLQFSLLNMTPFGVTDLHVNAASGLGHVLVIAQVLIGYLLLGVLLTRLAILFQST
jgi:hypothetical protein